jgi:protein-L-isoaspartate(D-aspartate) O-methyltransferase
MVKTALRPNYYEYFPDFEPGEILERLAQQPFHLATGLTLKNILAACTSPFGREATRRFLNSPPDDQRELLIEALAAAGISDRTLAAIKEVRREQFAPDAFVKYAYLNHYIPFSANCCLSSPGLVGLMLDRLAIEGSHKILEVGIGSGYHAACASELGGDRCEVVGIEVNENYWDFGMKSLINAGFSQIKTYRGDATNIALGMGSFDRLYMAASFEQDFPPALISILCDGGLIQGVRALRPEEFAGDTQDSWVRTNFSSYSEYRKDWRRFACLATCKKHGDKLIEINRLYAVRFVQLQTDDVTFSQPQTEDPFSELDVVSPRVELNTAADVVRAVSL